MEEEDLKGSILHLDCLWEHSEEPEGGRKGGKERGKEKGRDGGRGGKERGGGGKEGVTCINTHT